MLNEKHMQPPAAKRKSGRLRPILAIVAAVLALAVYLRGRRRTAADVTALTQGTAAKANKAATAWPKVKVSAQDGLHGMVKLGPQHTLPALPKGKGMMVTFCCQYQSS
jgi:hypothetical protein